MKSELLSVDGFSRAPSFLSAVGNPVFSLVAVTTRPATLWLSLCGVFVPDVTLPVCVCSYLKYVERFVLAKDEFS